LEKLLVLASARTEQGKGFSVFMTDILNHKTVVAGKNLVRDVTARSKVYAAIIRLQDAANQADALEAVREITGNLIGSEEVAIFKVDNEKAVCWLYWYVGIDPNKHAFLDVTREPSLQEALSGKIVFAGDNGAEKLLSIDHPVNAIVPILVGGAITAVLVIFSLLPQRTGLDEVDREVCEVLSHCADRAVRPNSQ
jgi:hypothetical protein